MNGLHPSMVLINMSKRNIVPKRKMNRVITNLDQNGTSGQLIIRGAQDPATLTRMIIQGTVNSEAVSGAVQELRAEIWRMSSSAGTVLPTFDFSGDVTYAQNVDLVWRGSWAIMRESINAGVVVPVNIDSKGNRILTRNEQLILWMNGSAAVILSGTLTAFYKEV